MIGRTTKRGGIAPMFIVDAEFGEEAGQHSWVFVNGYLAAQIGGKLTRLHRFLWSLKHGDCPATLDHINGVRWDCRIENLRPATHSLNNLNRTMPRKKHDLPRGVRANPTSRRNPFVAQIYIDKSCLHLGCFPTAEAASAAYEEARVEEMARRATVAYGTCSSSQVSA